MTTTVERKTIRGYFRDFKVLKACPLRYWGVQLVNVLHCTMYFSLLIIATIFLSKELGFSDEKAGYAVAGLGISASLVLLISGSITDSLGVRWSLYISLLGKLVVSLGLVWIAYHPEIVHRETIAIALLWVMGAFFAMLQTCFQSANQRFTTKKSRSAGFSLWYLFMNLGAAAAGFSVDIIQQWLKLSTTWVLLVGGLTSVPCLLAVFFMIRNDDQAYDDEEEPEEVKKKGTPWEIMRQVVTNKIFWKLVGVVTLMLGTRAIFLYMSILMPKYWQRTIGEDAPIGTFNAINPICIVIGLILFIPIAGKINVFKALTYGGIVSGSSLFILAIPPALLPFGFETSYYVTTVICMLVLSVGEVFWSPRLMEYTAAIAPKGQEGSYLGISMITWFFAKTAASAASGHMLTKWCPEGIGAKLRAGGVPYWETPEAMWFILGCIAVGTVLIIIFAKNFFVGGTALDDRLKAETATMASA